MSDASPFARADYYRVLQVDPSAHPEVLHAAYRTLLRVLGKHPDLGGSSGEAAGIIEAYTTLNDPSRRHAYDRWLRAHSKTPRPRVGALDGFLTTARLVLPEYNEAPQAPFARSFDSVLEGGAPFAPRLYIKSFSLLARVSWPSLFVLCRALAVARPGMLPSIDTVLLVANRVEDADDLLRIASVHAPRRLWNRLVIGIAMLDSGQIWATPAWRMPRAIRRLRQVVLPRQVPPSPRGV